MSSEIFDTKWDLRFLELAKLVSTWSKDPSTKAGAVITKGRDVISLGFNGFPSPMEDKPEWYANRDEKYSRVVHCEVNALIKSKRDVGGCTLYTWPFACCDRCVVQMAQAGIGAFVFPAPTADALVRWATAFEKTKGYLGDMGIPWIEYPREEVK